MAEKTQRKPVKHGLGYVMNSSWRPKRMTRAEAQRYADELARKSDLRRVAGCHGEIWECDEYFRVNVCAQPWDQSITRRPA